MIKQITVLIFLIHTTLSFISAQPYKQNKTYEYDSCIKEYRKLDSISDHASLVTCGLTDIGIPLHVFVISNEPVLDLKKVNRSKCVLLINNAIHAGEPAGVDASVEFAKNLLSSNSGHKLLEHVTVCIIPLYNIDGALNRSPFSRANQNGPEEYGFRGNARNLDLNRDLIKCDAINTKSFIEIFQQLRPHIFIDTHISNGADYPYVMTFIASQRNKLNKKIAGYMDTKFNPYLYEAMKKSGFEMSPYIETVGESPESGIAGFLDLPRFTTGYAALFNTIGYVTETHMLKPYDQQVESTIQFLKHATTFASKHAAEIIELRRQADSVTIMQGQFPVCFKLDTTQCDSIDFKGYVAKKKQSHVTGLDRLYYDRNEPFQKSIACYNNYKPTFVATNPNYYLIPKQWYQVVELLKLNGVSLVKLSRDVVLPVEAIYIDDYKTSKSPYEGHYLHSDITTRTENQKILFYKGDYAIKCNQVSNYFIATVLEPKSSDGYFAWNFFDSILQQKEWFSDYIFEEQAEKMLAEDEHFREEFDEYVQKNKLENDRWAQLIWIYRHSPYYEITHNRFPVFRYNDAGVLPLE